MTFEEFFKKKKIDLVQLKAAEPVLFAEFESHYAQMGEKSFDHTKKYWFNQLRRTYHTPEEVKIEKVKIENQLAEQTITESLGEKHETPAPPKAGFTPRFKAAVTKPAEQPAAEHIETETPVVGVVTNNSATEIKPEESATADDAPKPAVGFKPRFKAGVTKPVEQPTSEEPVKEDNPAIAEEAPKPVVGFKPRFKAGVTKPAEQPSEEPVKEDSSATTDEVPKPAVGFKPRFKAGVTKPAEQPTPEEPVKEDSPATADETPKPPVGFKPRFKAGVTKPKTDEE